LKKFSGSFVVSYNFSFRTTTQQPDSSVITLSAKSATASKNTLYAGGIRYVFNAQSGRTIKDNFSAYNITMIRQTTFQTVMFVSAKIITFMKYLAKYILIFKKEVKNASAVG
jgi:hypothetical protein